jgi:hypothetical protein
MTIVEIIVETAVDTAVKTTAGQMDVGAMKDAEMQKIQNQDRHCSYQEYPRTSMRRS